MRESSQRNERSSPRATFPEFHGRHYRSDRCCEPDPLRAFLLVLLLRRSFMVECLRSACPALWQRLYGDKKAKVDGETASDPKPRPPPVDEDDDDADETGSTYEAVWDLQGRNSNELTFRKGDRFKVQRRSDDWWTVDRLDETGSRLEAGVVPANYLTKTDTGVQMEPWNLGTMNRVEAQSHLMAPGNGPGAFLIRSMRSSCRVKHFKIAQTSDGRFDLDGLQQFTSLSRLVAHYRNNRLRLSNEDMLGEPCRPRQPPSEVTFPDDEWELPKEEFSLEDKLGSGYFADVYRGWWKSRIRVAVKIIKNDSELNHSEFQREVQILKRLRHRHLISLFAVCTASSPYYIITELMEKGSLLNLLRSRLRPERAELESDGSRRTPASVSAPRSPKLLPFVCFAFVSRSRGPAAGYELAAGHGQPGGRRDVVPGGAQFRPQRLGGPERSGGRRLHLQGGGLWTDPSHQGTRLLRVPESHPAQMERAGGPHPQEVLGQVRRVVLRRPAVRDGHLRRRALPRSERAGSGRPGQRGLQDAGAARLSAFPLRNHVQMLARRSRPAARLLAAEGANVHRRGGRRRLRAVTPPRAFQSLPVIRFQKRLRSPAWRRQEKRDPLWWFSSVCHYCCKADGHFHRS
ncbi:protein-tyrosine kinase 6b isoform X2 [Phycodurus eques]|uniref:protein-tyrosine kinase 6b isoform X2 n=1 Tax=Phycodurus eques TaxID=693459 RepID=UPI002ACEAED3|nr:protein-tyrosine kinase 6b isoform X2 [Phycodurus eques]